jgi:hypothetical protein
MTTAELIEKLKYLPKDVQVLKINDKPVTIAYYDGGAGNVVIN